MGSPKFESGTITKVPWVGIKGELCHEYDERGNHRLTHNGVQGEWAGFAGVARIKLGDRLFYAFTEHHAFCHEIVEAQAVAPRTLSDLYREDDNG